jgi:hypothetical protein
MPAGRIKNTAPTAVMVDRSAAQADVDVLGRGIGIDGVRVYCIDPVVSAHTAGEPVHPKVERHAVSPTHPQSFLNQETTRGAGWVP